MASAHHIVYGKGSGLIGWAVQRCHQGASGVLVIPEDDNRAFFIEHIASQAWPEPRIQAELDSAVLESGLPIVFVAPYHAADDAPHRVLRKWRDTGERAELHYCHFFGHHDRLETAASLIAKGFASSRELQLQSKSSADVPGEALITGARWALLERRPGCPEDGSHTLR